LLLSGAKSEDLAPPFFRLRDSAMRASSEHYGAKEHYEAKECATRPFDTAERCATGTGWQTRERKNRQAHTRAVKNSGIA
jgi:hypothetical protein